MIRSRHATFGWRGGGNWLGGSTIAFGTMEALSESSAGIRRFAANARFEQARIELEGAIEPCRIRIDQQFLGVEPETSGRVETPLRPQPIASANADVRDMRVENISCAAGEANPRDLAIRVVEQSEKDRLGAAGRDGDIDPAVLEKNPERLGAARSDAIETLWGSGAQVTTVGASRPVKCLTPAISFESATRSASATPVSRFCRAGSGSNRSI